MALALNPGREHAKESTSRPRAHQGLRCRRRDAACSTSRSRAAARPPRSAAPSPARRCGAARRGGGARRSRNTRSRLDDARSGISRDRAPCLAGYWERIDAIGQYRLPEREIGAGQRIGHDVARGPNLTRKRARRTQRLLDGVDAQVSTRNERDDFPRDGGLACARQATQDDQHGVASIRAPRPGSEFTTNAAAASASRPRQAGAAPSAAHGHKVRVAPARAVNSGVCAMTSPSGRSHGEPGRPGKHGGCAVAWQLVAKCSLAPILLGTSVPAKDGFQVT